MTDFINEYCMHTATCGELRREDIDRERAFITWSTCPQPALDAVRAVCREEGHFEELLETQAGCTVCNHCGPNTLGILYIHK